MKPQMHADNADENTHHQGLCHGKLTVNSLLKNTHHQILNPISYILTPELDTDFH